MVGYYENCRLFARRRQSLHARPNAYERASKSSNHDLSFSDSGPELGSLSLAIVLGVEQDSLYDYHVLLVDHSHGGAVPIVSSQRVRVYGYRKQRESAQPRSLCYNDRNYHKIHCGHSDHSLLDEESPFQCSRRHRQCQDCKEEQNWAHELTCKTCT